MAKRPKTSRNRKINAVFSQIKRKKRLKQVLILLAICITVMFFASGSRGTIQLVRFMKQKQDLEQEIQQLEQEKKALEIEKDKIENDPEYIEKIAREKYKMKKKDEQVYQIVEDEK